jgi:hypothetical protein
MKQLIIVGGREHSEDGTVWTRFYQDGKRVDGIRMSNIFEYGERQLEDIRLIRVEDLPRTGFSKALLKNTLLAEMTQTPEELSELEWEYLWSL